MPRNNDRVKIEKRNKPTPELDGTALDEYRIGGMDCVRFKKQVNSAGFDPRQPAQGNPSKHFDCRLLTLTIPTGFRRINKDEIDNPTYAGDRFRDKLVDLPPTGQSALLHVIYDLDPEEREALSLEEEEELLVTEDFCSQGEDKSIVHDGIETPCARSSAKSWTGGNQALFVRYSWEGIYDGGLPNMQHIETAKALDRTFAGKNHIAMVAMVIPDRTIVWVPFVEAGESPKGYYPKPFVNDRSYELLDVAFFDKPGIWIDRKLRFKL